MKQKFNIKKQGNFFVAFDLKNKKKSYGKISIKTGKFVGDTKALVELSKHFKDNQPEKKFNTKSAGHRIKEYLINLALNDNLPLDMNDLSAETFDDIINNVKPEDVEVNKMLDIAGQYLSYDTPEELIVMIKAIAKADSKGHHDQFIDDVDEVTPWEKVEYEFGCEEFLSLIGYKEGILN